MVISYVRVSTDAANLSMRWHINALFNAPILLMVWLFFSVWGGCGAQCMYVLVLVLFLIHDHGVWFRTDCLISCMSVGTIGTDLDYLGGFSHI